jgi:hypothetical protein
MTQGWDRCKVRYLPEAWKLLLWRPEFVAVHVCIVEAHKVLLPGVSACRRAEKLLSTLSNSIACERPAAATAQESTYCLNIIITIIILGAQGIGVSGDGTDAGRRKHDMQDAHTMIAISAQVLCIVDILLRSTSQVREPRSSCSHGSCTKTSRLMQYWWQ